MLRKALIPPLLPLPRYSPEEELRVRLKQIEQFDHEYRFLQSVITRLRADLDRFERDNEKLKITEEEMAVLRPFLDEIRKPEILVALEAVELYLNDEFPALSHLRSSINRLHAAIKGVQHDRK